MIKIPQIARVSCVKHGANLGQLFPPLPNVGDDYTLIDWKTLKKTLKLFAR